MKATRRTITKTPRRSRNGGSHALTTGISELLRSLGVILGIAYADNVPADAVASLEGAKVALVEARRTVQA